MKRLLLFAFVIVLPVAAGTMTRTARFTVEDLVLDRDAGYDVVNLRGYPALGQPGEPLLPMVVHSLVLPSGAVSTGVELTAVEWVDIPGEYRVGPAQPDAILPRPGVSDPPRLVSADAGVYASTEPHPATVLRQLETGTMSGYRIANVELRPVRYVPATG
ncbi:MAG: hypothetical protein R6X14_04725, partial [bacterium]